LTGGAVFLFAFKLPAAISVAKANAAYRSSEVTASRAPGRDR
jgi:hypothetical protein